MLKLGLNININPKKEIIYSKILFLEFDLVDYCSVYELLPHILFSSKHNEKIIYENFNLIITIKEKHEKQTLSGMTMPLKSHMIYYYIIENKFEFGTYPKLAKEKIEILNNHHIFIQAAHLPDELPKNYISFSFEKELGLSERLKAGLSNEHCDYDYIIHNKNYLNYLALEWEKYVETQLLTAL